MAEVLSQGGEVAGAAGEPDPVARERAMEGFQRMLAARREALARTIARMGDPAHGVELRHSADARYVLLLPDVAEPGMWRMQRFDPKGFSGHDLLPSKEALLESAAGQGFVEPDPGVLDRLAQTPAFQRGNFLTDLVRQINARELTHDQANAQLAAYDAAAHSAQMFGGDQRLQAWFAGSKAVDAGGQPRVLFHGTGGDFDEFVPSARGEFGAGIYLATEARGASDYAIYRAQGLPNVRPVWVSLQNPASGPEAAQVASWHGEENAQAELIRRGYDGVLDERSGQVVVFRPEQVKSSLSPHGPDADFMARMSSTPHPMDKTSPLTEWFAGSRVCHDDGSPLMLFHGTHRPIEGPGFKDTTHGPVPLTFFTNDPRVAGVYARAFGRGYGSGSNVVPVYLSIKNPKVLDFADREDDRDLRGEAYLAAEQGFDGLIVHNAHDGRQSATQYVAFDPRQIRFALSEPQRPVRAPHPRPAAANQRKRAQP